MLFLNIWHLADRCKEYENEYFHPRLFAFHILNIYMEDYRHKLNMVRINNTRRLPRKLHTNSTRKIVFYLNLFPVFPKRQTLHLCTFARP